MGAGGKHTSNIHRDFVQWGNKAMGGPELYPYDVQVTYKKTDDHGSEKRWHKVLLPHEVFAYIYESGDEIFNEVFMGGEGKPALARYWTNVWSQNWAREHPAFVQHNVPVDHAIPLGCHADKGQHVKRDKILAMSTRGVLCTLATLFGTFLYTICPDEILIKGRTDEELYAIWVWSFWVLLGGVWPDRDHHGRPWPTGCRRWHLGKTGKRLAGPWVSFDFFLPCGHGHYSTILLAMAICSQPVCGHGMPMP